VHHVDVLEVLARQLRHRDVEHIQVLLADQVQQKVERAFEALQDDLQRIRRDVQILRHREHRLAVDSCDAGYDGDDRRRFRASHRRLGRCPLGWIRCVDRGFLEVWRGGHGAAQFTAA